MDGCVMDDPGIGVLVFEILVEILLVQVQSQLYA